MQKQPNDKKRMYLFSEECPEGQIFDVTEEELEELLDSGWAESPSELDLPEKEPEAPTAEQVEKAKPGDLVAMVKNLGYHVMTDVELAQANAKAGNFDIAKVSDDDLVTEAERRGLKQPEDNTQELVARFFENPKSLTKEELVVVGAAHGLELKMQMKEENMIAKIGEAMNSSEE